MEGDNAYLCEDLGKRVPAVKRTAIRTLPPLLCVHLKRFEFDYHNQTRHKLRDRWGGSGWLLGSGLRPRDSVWVWHALQTCRVLPALWWVASAPASSLLSCAVTSSQRSVQQLCAEVVQGCPAQLFTSSRKTVCAHAAAAAAHAQV